MPAGRVAITLGGIAIQEPPCDSKTLHRAIDVGDLSGWTPVGLAEGETGLADERVGKEVIKIHTHLTLELIGDREITGPARFARPSQTG